MKKRTWSGIKILPIILISLLLCFIFSSCNGQAGKLKPERIYNKQGKLVQEKTFFSDGNLKSEKTFNDKGHFTEEKDYSKDGSLISDQKF